MYEQVTFGASSGNNFGQFVRRENLDASVLLFGGRQLLRSDVLSRQ